MSEIRVLPLPNVTGVWDYDASRYPDRVRIPMADGKVVTYRIETEMPHPQVMKTLELIRRMRERGNGYQRNEYQGKHAKK